MRVVFFGTPEFAVDTLDALLNHGIDVAAVVTQPDRPGGRSHSTLVPPPVKRRAQSAGLPVLQPDRPRGAEFESWLTEQKADLGIVVAYGHLLRPEILAIPSLGMVNLHASLLPRWRGAAPIHWAIMAGDQTTGVSVMRMEAGLDTGAIWQRNSMPIAESDTTGDLFPLLAQLGAAAMIAALPGIGNGVEPVPQDDTVATFAPKVTRETARIDWNRGAREISCLIRGVDPAPGAWTTLDGRDVKLYGARVEEEHHLASGEISAGSGAMLVGADDGAVRIEIAQPAGGRRLPAAEWARQHSGQFFK